MGGTIQLGRMGLGCRYVVAGVSTDRMTQSVAMTWERVTSDHSPENQGNGNKTNVSKVSENQLS